MVPTAAPWGTFELDNWIRAISHGDRDALAALYRATSSAVYAYALSILRDPHDAEDAMHDCYVSIWNCAKDYKSQGKPMAWIMTVTRNLCLKQLRRQTWFVPLTDMSALARPGSDPDDLLMLRQCLELLTDEERQIVVLHAVAGMKHRQIGQMLGLKTSTVLSKYRRSIQKLREMV